MSAEYTDRISLAISATIRAPRGHIEGHLQYACVPALLCLASVMAMGSAVSGSGSLLVLSVSVVGILFTAILLLAYYLFLACSWRRRHSQSAPAAPPPFATDQQTRPRRALEEAAIRRIPTLRYQQNKQQQHCAVCLADFREGERLRRLPPCLHSFHIDCIDAWLAAAVTCPLCRAHVAAHHDAISSAAAADTSSVGTTRQPDDDDPLLSGVHQPMSRSLSLDSCADKHLYLALRTIIFPAPTLLGHPGTPGSKAEEASVGVSGRRLRRSFFSFSHGRSSPTPILPI